MHYSVHVLHTNMMIGAPLTIASSAVLSPTLSRSVVSMSCAKRREPYNESVSDHL